MAVPVAKMLTLWTPMLKVYGHELMEKDKNTADTHERGGLSHTSILKD